MPHKLTAEQEDIIETAVLMYNDNLSDNPDLLNILLVDAVAGSSKTFTLKQIAKKLPHTNQRYITYLKALADEAALEFPTYTVCSTGHSLAYAPIIKYGLNLDGEPGKSRTIQNFKYKSIKEKVDYEVKLHAVTLLETFLLSSYTDIHKFMEVQEASDIVIGLCVTYFTKMVNNEIPVSHSFYLKLYHILLADGCIHYDKPFDVLMLDEFGDINPVTLEIFKLLPAVLKIAVGDKLQNIYSFNHTINGFEALKGIGITKHLSQSFRCSIAIAGRIEDFCQRHIDPNIVFKGTHHKDTTVSTEAIISRTNSGLIGYMITLVDQGIPFNLKRGPQEIFSLMLILMNLKPGCTIYDPEYNYLLKDMNRYYKSSSLRIKHKTLLAYINAEHGFADPAIKTAISTLRTHTFKAVYEAYNKAKFYHASNETYPLSLSTAHSSKGATFDKITVAADFDLSDILEMYPDERTEADTEALRLYYVTCSRARLVLDNAIFLEK